ncbi:MAG: response regulator [Vicinamibacterales bacterium]
MSSTVPSEDSSRILVVEDSDTQALQMMLLLEQEGFEPSRCATSEEALDYLSRNRPNLIVIDYHLPGMRGDELCRQIRMNPATSDIMILILTDDVQGVIERQGLESGADDHVSKSTDTDALMARIQALLRNQRRSTRPLSLTPGQFFQRYRVVVVDDSQSFLEYARQQLEAEGYQVMLFDSAQKAIAHLNRESCDCLLVDLVMPEIDGIELCRRLEPFRARTGSWFPILMVTGRDSKDDMMRALEAGVDDFVGKSNDVAILRARIRALLRRKTQQDEHERISNEFRDKELEVVRERAEREAAERRAAISEALETRSRELRETQAQLVQAAKMASLGELVAGIAHEVNNPLAYVMSHLDTVERSLDRIEAISADQLPPPAHAALDKARTRVGDMRGGLTRVRDLVLKLRTFSRLDEGEFKSVDMRESIESVLTILQHRFRNGVRTDIAYADDNVISCYPAPLNQVIMNLVSNAIDAVEGNGIVRIRTERGEDTFRIIVADNGPGISADLRERIFEPFFTTKPVGKGMGLGLAIVYRIMQAHNGAIAVRDREGGGAEFTVSLPLNLKEASHVG